MPKTLKTDRFFFEYGEEYTEDRVLWENHCHPYYEMIAVLEGEIFAFPEGVRYRIATGDVIVIPQLVYHTVRSVKKSMYRRLIARFDPLALPKPLRDALGTTPFFFSSLHTEELRRVCMQEDGAFFAPLAESIMIQLLYEGVTASTSEKRHTEDNALASALHYIEENLARPISLDEIAHATLRSKSSFCHLFREKMKISPKQYILQKRMALAAKLLEARVSPSLVAQKVGYQNYSDFYRMYKKVFGTSPKSTPRD